MPEAFDFPNTATPLGSSAYYSLRLSPERLRRPLALLHAWNKTLGDISTEVSDPGVARLKLQWWREEMERTFAGQPRHPLSQALAPYIEDLQLPLTPFLQQAEHVEARILRSRPADFPALEQWLEQGQGALAELLGRCHGVTDAERIELIRRCGAFWAGVYLLRDYGALLRQEFDPLPPGGTTPRQWGLHLQSLRPPATKLPLPLAIRSNILAVLLEEIADSDFDVRDQRIGLPPLRKLWIGWRSRRRNRSV